MPVYRDKGGRFQPGSVGNPVGSRRQDTMVRWDLREAARAHCKEAIEIIAREMHNEDARVRLLASQLMLERGYGKPLVQVDAEVAHKFCVVPTVMDQKLWLERRGQPILEGEATPVREVCPDSPTTLDRTPSDEPDPTKLN
jgi:hypothetical protein